MQVKELRWLAGKINKTGEKSDMMLGSIDKKETERQLNTSKRKSDEKDAEIKRKRNEEL